MEQKKQWTSKKGRTVKFLKASDLGDQGFEGVFIESYTGGKFNTTNHKFKALASLSLESGISISEGDMVIINGVGSLNNQLAEVIQGETVRIEYRGQSEMKNGKFKGTLAHNVEVFTDASGTIASADELRPYLYDTSETA